MRCHPHFCRRSYHVFTVLLGSRVGRSCRSLDISEENAMNCTMTLALKLVWPDLQRCWFIWMTWRKVVKRFSPSHGTCYCSVDPSITRVPMDSFVSEWSIVAIFKHLTYSLSNLVKAGICWHKAAVALWYALICKAWRWEGGGGGGEISQTNSWFNKVASIAS